jgi:S-adenosylmethionine uptake transporter
MNGLSANARGAMIMMASMACFTFGDACVKALGVQMPLSQIMTLRGIVSSLFVYVLARGMGQLRFDLPRRDWMLVGLRSVAEVASAYFFLGALIRMPLANVTALLQMLPLTVTLGSAVFFGEPVGWRRWVAIAIGFCGMLLIVQPGTDGFDIWSIYALIAVFCVTVRDLVTRRMSREVPSLTVTFAAALSVLVFSAVWSLQQDWVALETGSAVLLLLASAFIVGGYSFSVMVMRVGDVSFVAPFRYTGLIWALIIGVLVFGDWPAPLMLAGAALIVATGLYTLLREAAVKRRARRARAAV